jgi:hypothetical protein
MKKMNRIWCSANREQFSTNGTVFDDLGRLKKICAAKTVKKNVEKNSLQKLHLNQCSYYA